MTFLVAKSTIKYGQGKKDMFKFENDWHLNSVALSLNFLILRGPAHHEHFVCTLGAGAEGYVWSRSHGEMLAQQEWGSY